MTTIAIRTASDLKYAVEQSGKNPHFFTRSTMKFFGDTMRNFGVRRATVTPNYPADAAPVECWELYRRRPVKHNLQASHYFHAETFETVYPKKD